MRLLLVSIFTFLTVLGLATTSVSASEIVGDQCSGLASDSSFCKNSNQTSNPISGENGIIVRVAQIVTWVIGVVSVIMVIYGGLKYILSNGDANAVNSAKNTILYAVVGVVVAAFSQGIIIFVISRV